jgi:3-oxoacyl-[acyl-carrier protein] reductase
MDLGIAGKSALVTGGSRGIGRAISLDLAREGCRVTVAARGQADIDDVVAEIRAAGGEAVGISADLTDLDAYGDVVGAARSAFGDPDIAIFNLREPKHGSIEQMDEAELAEALHLTTLCFSRLVRAVSPAMKARGWGRIVAIGSAAARQPIRPYAGFDYDLANPSRAAAMGLLKSWASRLAPSGVTINTIATGTFDTDYARGFFAARARDAGLPLDDVLQSLYQAIPAGRMGDVSEISGLCTFLCSQRGGYTTGETVLCDGGFANSMP